MKIVENLLIFNKGDFFSSYEFPLIEQELAAAIKLVVWGAEDKFVINPKPKENGVNPIKKEFIKHLVSCGWEPEVRMSIVKGMSPGPIDVIKRTSQGIFAVEWETGNISSSHRALNKIALGIIQKQIIGGILILPKRNLSQYLTDRIGNYEELAPYFELYSNLNIEAGVMGIIGVDYDKTSIDVPIIPKGKDGNAR
jgi:hypothetical protein